MVTVWSFDGLQIRPWHGIITRLWHGVLTIKRPPLFVFDLYHTSEKIIQKMFKLVFGKMELARFTIFQILQDLAFSYFRGYIQ
jgi:hypothetical protein